MPVWAGGGTNLYLCIYHYRYRVISTLSVAVCPVTVKYLTQYEHIKIQNAFQAMMILHMAPFGLMNWCKFL